MLRPQRCLTIRRSIVTWLTAVAGLLLASYASGAEVVVVSLTNGRILTGEIDSRTDETELWLHSTEPSIVLLSSVPWSEVASARIQKKTLSQGEFRDAAIQLKQPIPADVFRQSPASIKTSQPPVMPRVRTMEIVPTLANWDRDAEPDGVEVRINPLTSEGQVAAINGIVTVRLVGRRLGTSERLESRGSMGFWTDGASTREYMPRRGNARYQELGRWSERLQATDATNSGYVLRLPFRNVHPEHDLDVALDGQIDAHLSVTGQGVYDATSPIQLRRFSPLREELQLYRGTRLFPDEYSNQR